MTSNHHAKESTCIKCGQTRNSHHNFPYLYCYEFGHQRFCAKSDDSPDITMSASRPDEIKDMNNSQLLSEFIARQNTCTAPALMERIRLEILSRMGGNHA